MADETLLVTLLGGLHLLGFAFAAVLLAPCLRDESIARTARARDDEDGGGGGSDRLGPAPPRGPRPGGLPLLDARPARVRLRDERRLGELLPGRERRPAHAPGQVPARPVPALRAGERRGSGTYWRTRR